jgi:hypothetical protein
MIGSVIYLRGNLEGYVEHAVFEIRVDDRLLACVSFDAPTDDGVFTNRQYMLGWRRLGRASPLATTAQAAFWRLVSYVD